MRLPGGIDDRELAQGRPVALDVTALNTVWPDLDAYGAMLTEQLFADPILDRAWTTARSLAEADQRPLRVHLDLDPQQPELQRIIWESLHIPHTRRPLATSERILLARYLGTPDLRPLPAASGPQALIVVANPGDLANDNLPPIDVDGEVARARAALVSVPATVLAHGQGAGPTLTNICAALRAGPGLLYLVAHGALYDDAYLWLEDEQGKTARVSGAELIAALQQLAERPLLIVLNACRSGGDGINVLTALAPRLVQAGIPAVIGAQGDVPMSLVAAVMPTFLRELRRDGQADRALAAARGTRRNAPDWWRLALWTHRRDGQIWNPVTPLPTHLLRVQHGDEAAITCSRVAASFLWVETFTSPPRRRAASLLDLQNAEAIAAAFDALPVPAGVELDDGTVLRRPWPKLHGQHFWYAYLERQALGSIRGHDAYRQLIPIHVTLPWTIGVAGFESVLTPLHEARIPTGTRDAQAGDLLYGHPRSRAVWIPRRFSTTQPAAALGCYHRNLVFSALQVESLGALVINAARQLDETGQLGGVQRSLAQRAYGILSRMHSGNSYSTYRSMSSCRHLADNDILPALNRVRAAFDKAPLLEDRG